MESRNISNSKKNNSTTFRGYDCDQIWIKAKYCRYAHAGSFTAHVHEL